jgi:hypothetical protein
MAEPKKVGKALAYFTPVRAVSRAFSSVSQTKGSLVEAAKTLGASLPGQSAPGDYEEGDIRNISDAKERFQAMYELHEWTEPQLLKQLKSLRMTKITAMVMSVFSVAGVMLLAWAAPMWLSLFLIPVSGAVMVLGIAQTFKYALYQAQIELREFISAREFANLPDFCERLIG